MKELWIQVFSGLIAGIVLIVIGAVLQPFFKRLVSPKARREAKVKQGAEKAIQPFIQNIHGPVRQEIHIHYQATTTGMNAAYVTTGEGLPRIPDPRELYGPPPATPTGFVRPLGGWPWEKGLDQPKNGTTFRLPLNTDTSDEKRS